DFIHKEEFIHPLFAENFYRLLNVLQDASHDNEELSLKVHDYLRTNSSTYFERSTAYLFLDVLLGFIMLVMNYPNKEDNVLHWQQASNNDEILKCGRVVGIAFNGFIT